MTSQTTKTLKNSHVNEELLNDKAKIVKIKSKDTIALAGKPTNTKSLAEKPMDKTKIHEKPMDKTKIFEKPMDKTKIHEKPMDKTKIHDQTNTSFKEIKNDKQDMYTNLTNVQNVQNIQNVQNVQNVLNTANTANVVKPKPGEIYVKVKDNDQWVKFSEKEPLDLIAKGLVAHFPENKEAPSIEFVDFGGVAEYFLGGRQNVGYHVDPPKISFSNAYIFSFVPPNARFKDIDLMAKCAEKAGFVGTIIVTDKHGPRDKANVLNALSDSIKETYNKNISYFEDTARVLDDVGKLDVSKNILKIWIQPPIESRYHTMCPLSIHNTKTMTVSEFVNMIVKKL